MESPLPRILVIDDEFGRTVASGVNRDRERICSALGLVDVTETRRDPARSPGDAVAEATFVRGQKPAKASIGDVVENDLEGVLAAIGGGWKGEDGTRQPWAMVLVDLAFCTGAVTAESDRDQPGMAEGRRTDLQPADYFGLRILEAAREAHPRVPVAVLSSQERSPVDAPIDRLGHCGFVSKTGEGSARYLASVLWRHGLFPDPEGAIVGRSPALLSVLRDARRLSAGEGNVLLAGERGTGKELFARFVHRFSRRGSVPLVTVDCGAVQGELFASDLFGHLPGAFTGAAGRKTGRIVTANGGHMFLDEVGNMPMRVQEGLLRVIDDGIVMPLGAADDRAAVRVDVRFIFATNADLEGRAISGTFKSDLLDRLRRGGGVVLPPLRARREDISVLARSFLAKAAASTPECQVREISPEAVAFLEEYDWPGNVRQLEDFVRQTVSRHRDVRTLYPAQIDLPAGPTGTADARRGGLVEVWPTEKNDPSGGGERLPIPTEDPGRGLRREDLEGALPKVRASYARALAELLAAALDRTRPFGRDYNYTNAVDCIRGARKSTTEAADEIKRILKIDPEATADLTAVSPLKDALYWALTTRPATPRKQ